MKSLRSNISTWKFRKKAAEAGKPEINKPRPNTNIWHSLTLSRQRMDPPTTSSHTQITLVKLISSNTKHSASHSTLGNVGSSRKPTSTRKSKGCNICHQLEITATITWLRNVTRTSAKVQHPYLDFPYITSGIDACPYFYHTQTWIKRIVCITRKNIPKLATSCNLRVIAVKASKLR